MVKNTRKSNLNKRKHTKKKIHGLSKKNLTIKTKFFNKIIKKHHEKKKNNTKKRKGQKQKGGKDVVKTRPENFDVFVKPNKHYK